MNQFFGLGPIRQRFITKQKKFKNATFSLPETLARRFLDITPM